MRRLMNDPQACPDTASRPLQRSTARRLSGVRHRRGAAVIEFAVVAPIFFLMVFGMIEFGRMVMVHQLLVGAVREGARLAVIDGTTAAEVQDTVRSYLTASSIDGEEVQVQVTPNPAVVPKGVPITVRTNIAFDKVSWLPAPFFLREVTLNAASTMRHE